MEWEKVESLQGQAVFTGSLTTMMKRPKFMWMQNRIFLPRFYNWPESVHVDLVTRDGELAFVPKPPSFSNTSGHDEAATKEYWGTERADYSIWVDFAGN
ncbi:hypothetical protein E2562_036676 [Oryza meyeriana var. granulata]|uniref:Uncharacterized protein n=1 Tax=Oryza meyeriana var. granulata TaxID=110450 RepID=A0A6G1DT02_9ORYZ|nr:hypothetical protein E2562_035948 [Oryza meyeriana var. granulata]KAF0915521.1 hypothetical protein E2562_036676 [Oryza meyeriana var. granulata]